MRCVRTDPSHQPLRLWFVVVAAVAVVAVVVVELFISNKYYCWRGQAWLRPVASKSVTFLVGNAHFPFFTHKIFIPVQVKLCAPKAGELLLWVSTAWCALFSWIFSSFFIFFTKCFKTYNFGKAIALSGKHEFAFSSRTCRQKLHFCVSTVNECVFIILLLA